MMPFFFLYQARRPAQRLPADIRLYKQMDESTAYLIEDCRRGKQPAQLTLYTKYAQRLYIACLRITGNRMEAEEAMQDTFLKVFSHLAQYRSDQNFEAWIHRIAVHTAIDYVRRQTQAWEDLSPNHQAGQPDEADESEEEAIHCAVAQVKTAMQKLPAGYRIVLSLYLFEGYDTEEIASILNIQPSGVRTQYLRAKRKLLEIIKAN
jgi:RNA polymerase sigma-70 factor (ECF subfamily)